jgi:hypothetical protein
MAQTGSRSQERIGQGAPLEVTRRTERLTLHIVPEVVPDKKGKKGLKRVVERLCARRFHQRLKEFSRER